MFGTSSAVVVHIATSSCDAKSRATVIPTHGTDCRRFMHSLVVAHCPHLVDNHYCISYGPYLNHVSPDSLPFIVSSQEQALSCVRWPSSRCKSCRLPPSPYTAPSISMSDSLATFHCDIVEGANGKRASPYQFTPFEHNAIRGLTRWPHKAATILRRTLQSHLSRNPFTCPFL